MNDLLRQLLKEIDRLWFFVSIGVTGILTILYFFATGSITDLNIRNFSQSVITNLIPIFLTIAVSYPLLQGIRKIKSEKETQDLINKLVPEIISATKKPRVSTYNHKRAVYYRDFSSVPWRELLTKAHSLDISIDYVDSWINENVLQIKKIFDKNGIVRIVLSEYSNKALTEIIHKRIPELDSKAVEDKIESTFTRLTTAINKSHGISARFETYFVNELIWYAGVRIDKKILVLALFDQSRLMRASAPTFVIDLSDDEDTKNWFEREFNELIKRANNQIINDKRQL